MTTEYETYVDTAIEYTINGIDSVIYGYVDTSLCGTIISNTSEIAKRLIKMLDNFDMFKISLKVDAEDRSVTCKTTVFTDKHNKALFEFVFDTLYLGNNRNYQSELAALLVKSLNIANLNIDANFDGFIKKNYNIGNNTANTSGLILINIRSSKTNNQNKIIIPDISPSEYYSYMLADFKKSKKSMDFNKINSNPDYNDPEIQKIINEYIDMILIDPIYDCKILVEFKSTSIINHPLKIINTIESHVIFEEKFISMAAEYQIEESETETVEVYPLQLDSIMNPEDIIKGIENMVYNTFSMMYKLTSQPVNVHIEYRLHENEGKFV